MKTITICSSVNFYEQVVDMQSQLEKLGLRAIIPASAEKMKTSGNFDASQYRTWLDDSSKYDTKAALMRGHFAEIEKADALLVLNYEKYNIQNYIGGNVLIEMGIAFYLNKPIFILNGLPSESTFLEEILGMKPILLSGTIDTLVSKYKTD